MINIEELRADIEAGTPGDWSARDTEDYAEIIADVMASPVALVGRKADANRIARLPQLEREYLAMREALKEMLIEFDIPAYATSDEIAACQQARKALGETQ